MKRPPNRNLMMMAASSVVMAAVFLHGLARFIH
jgi:hypothetical protein